MGREILGRDAGVLRKRAGEGFDGVIENHAGHCIEDHQQTDEDDHIGQHRRLFDRLEDGPLNQQTAQKGDGHRGEKRAPVGPT
jgi:hypothetical protein